MLTRICWVLHTEMAASIALNSFRWMACLASTHGLITSATMHQCSSFKQHSSTVLLDSVCAGQGTGLLLTFKPGARNHCKGTKAQCTQ